MSIINLASGLQVLTSNVYLLRGDRPTLVDAGSQFDIVDRLEGMDLERPPERLLVTHTHPDHVDNVGDVRDRFDVETLGVDGDSPYVDRPLADGDSVTLGDETFEIIHTPGHATDHLCAYAADSGRLISGDLVFANGGIGRVDLPGGDSATLQRSIERVHETTASSLSSIYPGHGPAIETDAPRHLASALQAARSL